MKASITRARLLAHCASYPKMEIRDLFKYIFQSALGCEHLLSSETDAIRFIQTEYAALAPGGSHPPERLDGAYSRVFLSCLDEGLSPEILGKLFCRSAKTEENGKEALLEKIKVACALVAERELPFEQDAFERELSAWRDAGYPAVRHTEQFRNAYAPAYRVIAEEYVRFLPLLAAIDRKMAMGRTIVAIEGGSASGKTTLASLLSSLYDCTVFHMDDFFLRPEQRTPARFAEIGGNVDRERFLSEVLWPLSEGKEVVYRPFDCGKQALASPITVNPKPLVIVEGAYSMHPDLSSYYDLSAFLDIDPSYQKKRIERRNSPALAVRFFQEWIPMERRYFEGTDIKGRVDLVLAINE